MPTVGEAGFDSRAKKKASGQSLSNEHHRTPLDDFVVDRDDQVITQRVQEFFDVRHLERLRSGTTYPDIAAYVAEMMRRSPLRECDAELIVDQTGVGRPVVDLLRRAYG